MGPSGTLGPLGAQRSEGGFQRGGAGATGSEYHFLGTIMGGGGTAALPVGEGPMPPDLAWPPDKRLEL